MEKCPRCGSENIISEIMEFVRDYYNPMSGNGHGQEVESEEVDVCGDCGYNEYEN